MIHPLDWSTTQSKATLSAIYSVASLHGTEPLLEEEKELIEGVRSIILKHPEVDYDTAHLQPAELAELVEDDLHRMHAAQLIGLMPYAVRPFSTTKSYIAEKFLNALGHDTHLMEDYIGARQKHALNMEYCALRKLGRDVFPRADPNGRNDEVLKLIKEAEGDPQVLARYQSLKDYPKSSLGRGFYDFYSQFDWPLPGDPLWISEDLTVRHDLVHILCDYDISINGEFCVSAFAAGNSSRFNWMIAMLGFTPPYVSTEEHFHPDQFFAAYQRGVDATESFVDAWDFWPLMEFQISDLRSRYNISTDL